jgi:hypothetical protein
VAATAETLGSCYTSMTPTLTSTAYLLCTIGLIAVQFLSRRIGPGDLLARAVSVLERQARWLVPISVAVTALALFDEIMLLGVEWGVGHSRLGTLRTTIGLSVYAPAVYGAGLMLSTFGVNRVIRAYHESLGKRGNLTAERRRVEHIRLMLLLTALLTTAQIDVFGEVSFLGYGTALTIAAGVAVAAGLVVTANDLVSLQSVEALAGMPRARYDSAVLLILIVGAVLLQTPLSDAPLLLLALTALTSRFRGGNALLDLDHIGRAAASMRTGHVIAFLLLCGSGGPALATWHLVSSPFPPAGTLYAKGQTLALFYTAEIAFALWLLSRHHIGRGWLVALAAASLLTRDLLPLIAPSWYSPVDGESYVMPAPLITGIAMFVHAGWLVATALVLSNGMRLSRLLAQGQRRELRLLHRERVAMAWLPPLVLLAAQAVVFYLLRAQSATIATDYDLSPERVHMLARHALAGSLWLLAFSAGTLAATAWMVRVLRRESALVEAAAALHVSAALPAAEVPAATGAVPSSRVLWLPGIVASGLGGVLLLLFGLDILWRLR